MLQVSERHAYIPQELKNHNKKHQHIINSKIRIKYFVNIFISKNCFESKKGFYRCFQLHHLWQRRNPTIMSLHCFGRRHKSPNSFNDLWWCLLNSSIILIPSLFVKRTSNLRLHSVFYSSSANYGWTCHRGTNSICDQGLLLLALHVSCSTVAKCEVDYFPISRV